MEDMIFIDEYRLARERRRPAVECCSAKVTEHRRRLPNGSMEAAIWLTLRACRVSVKDRGLTSCQYCSRWIEGCLSVLQNS